MLPGMGSMADPGGFRGATRAHDQAGGVGLPLRRPGADTGLGARPVESQLRLPESEHAGREADLQRRQAGRPRSPDGRGLASGGRANLRRKSRRPSQAPARLAAGPGDRLRPGSPAARLSHLGAPPAECLTDMYLRWRQDMLERPTAWRPPRRTEYPFEARRYPFLPRLMVNRDVQLCDAFLNGLRQDFLARHRDQDGLLNEGHAFKEPPMSVGHWIAWPSEHGAKGDGQTIDLAALDLDGDGKQQLLLQVMQPFNSRGNSYSLLIRSKTSTDELEDEIGDFMKSRPGTQKTATLSRRDRAFCVLGRHQPRESFQDPVLSGRHLSLCPEQQPRRRRWRRAAGRDRNSQPAPRRRQ